MTRTIKPAWRLPLTYAFIAVGILRFYYCFQVPSYTTDLFRNLGYGRQFWHYGLRIYSALPEDFAPEPYQFFWSTHGYTYPAVALAFFVLTALISPGIVHAKIIINLLIILNTWMVHRITKDRWATLLYWANPISIWFGSHEGQFEPFVSTWIILGVWLLRHGSPWAMLCLAMGIQAKMFPVFLIPTFFLTNWRRPAPRWAGDVGIFAVSFLPSIILALTGDYVLKLFSPAYVTPINHIPWLIPLRASDLVNFRPQPLWLIYVNAVVSKGTLFVLVYLAYWRYRLLRAQSQATAAPAKLEESILDYAPALFFLCFLKSSPMTNFWHLMLLPDFAMTIQDPRHRRLVFLLACLFGGRSLYAILLAPFFGHFGDRNPEGTMQILSICFDRF